MRDGSVNYAAFADGPGDVLARIGPPPRLPSGASAPAAERGAAAPESAEVVTPAPATGRRAKIVLSSLVGAAVLAGGVAYALGLGKESTDDAFVEGHVANVSARVPGQVAEVRVHDNELVEAGQVLVQLDDRDAEVRVATAKADVAAARAALAAAERQAELIRVSVDAKLRQASGGMRQAKAAAGASEASIEQARADLAAAQSRRDLAVLELGRAERLQATGAVAPAELDVRRAQAEQASAALDQARARLAVAEAQAGSALGTITTAEGRLLAAHTGPEQVGAAEAQVEVARARVAQAEAALAQAELNLSYMTIRAPVRGVISRRTVEPGQMTSPERPMLSIAATDDLWIVANFKEDQLAEVAPGQRVDVKLDAYGRRAFTGHVESLAGGSGSRFALLPPDNASGNFTKVVQRIPVLIRLDGPDAKVQLRAGMSANVTVHTRDEVRS